MSLIYLVIGVVGVYLMLTLGYGVWIVFLYRNNPVNLRLFPSGLFVICMMPFYIPYYYICKLIRRNKWIK